MLKAGIIGAAGYTGGECFRLLSLHPDVELAFIQSDSQAGKKIYEVHSDCYGLGDHFFEKNPDLNVNVIFMCKSHGESKIFLEQNKIPAGTRIIDLSTDFRHRKNNNCLGKEFVYGLPELNRNKIASAHHIANPGCFATAIQLALLPLAEQKLLRSDIHITATTGSTGAGQSLSDSNHFPWRSNNHSAYKILDHQHEKEIHESISSMQSSFDKQFFFVPQRGAFTRGIYAVTYVEGDFNTSETKKLYEEFYAQHPFTHMVPFEPDVKQVVNTNHCYLHLQFQKNKLIIVSVIDNLLKGAAGQAVQNMNIMFGLNEKSGLQLKPSAF